MYARLLLFHLPRADVLRRLWDAVAPGGRLVVQDYDVRGVRVAPADGGVDRRGRPPAAGLTAAGCDVSVGTRLPQLFAEAGVGEPDGTDVAGRLDGPRRRGRLLEAMFRSVLPAALARGVTTEAEAEALLAALGREVATGGRHTVVPAAPGDRLEAQVTHEEASDVAPAPLRAAARPTRVDVRRVRAHFDFPDIGRVVTNNAASTQPPRELLDLLPRAGARATRTCIAASRRVAADDGAVRGVLRHDRRRG